MRDLVVATVVFGLLPFVIKRPFWGVLLSCWLGYMNPHLLCYGFMQTMPVVQIVALATMVGMLVSREAKRMVWSREIVVLVVFIGWMTVTTSRAFYPELAQDQLTKVLKIQILNFMALLMLTSRERVHALVAVIALSLAFYGVKGGIFTIMHGGVFRVQGPGGFIGGNNEIALALVMTIPLLRYLQLQARRRLVRLALAVTMVLTALAAIGSQSRGALVGIALMGTMFWLKSRNKFATALLMSLAVLLVVFIMPESWYQRMSSIQTYDQDASSLGRINAWWTAFNIANDRITGGGFETFRWSVFALYAPEPDRVHDVHSIYFEVLGEHGWSGLTLFLSMLGLTWLKCSATIRRTRRIPELTWARDLSAMIQVSMVAYMAAGAFLGLAYFDYIYHLVAVAVVVHHLTLQHLAAAAAQPLQPQLQPKTWPGRLVRPLAQVRGRP